WREAELAVKSMRVARREYPPPQTLQLRVTGHAGHQPLGKPSPAVLRQYEYIAQIGDGRVVGNDAGKSDLPITLQQREAQGVRQRPLDRGRGNSLGPIRRCQKFRNQGPVDPGRITRDGEGTADP